MNPNENTLGEFCAGIGGFGLGFEKAGWRTAWQIELDDLNRAVLAHRFPHARQFKNLLDWPSFNLPKVRCITFGSPCQDISIMGKHGQRRGLDGSRSGLFFTIIHAIRHLQPEYIAFENVPHIVNSNHGRDLQAVLGTITQCGYSLAWRIMDAQYFGIPQRRRRFILVGRLGGPAPTALLDDAGTMVPLPSALAPGQARPGNRWAGYTLTAPPKINGQGSRINMGSELLIAEENRWHSMVERGREIELHGIPAGLDGRNTEQAYAAGNAIVPALAEWIARIINNAKS